MAQFSQRYDSEPFPYSSAPSAPLLPTHHDFLLTAAGTGPPFPSSYPSTSATPPFLSSSFSTPPVNAGIPTHPFSSEYLPPTGYSYAPHSPARYSNCSFASAHEFSQGGFGSFPPGTSPEIVQSFHNIDRDQSGVIDERELQAALSSRYQQFSIGTVRLLLFIFSNRRSTLGIGPPDFALLWDCIGRWRTIFRKFYKDCGDKINSAELRDALRTLGYAVPPPVIEVVMAQYSDCKGGRKALDFDKFVEFVAIIRGLTQSFRERDTRSIGSASLTYDSFMSMVVPFIVP